MASKDTDGNFFQAEDCSIKIRPVASIAAVAAAAAASASNVQRRPNYAINSSHAEEIKRKRDLAVAAAVAAAQAAQRARIEQPVEEESVFRSGFACNASSAAFEQDGNSPVVESPVYPRAPNAEDEDPFAGVPAPEELD